MIEINHLTKNYGTFKAVDDFSFAVAPGEIIGLIGPNGARKTSTLRCIVGIQAPSSGSISIGGYDTAKDPVEAKRRLAFMADEPQLFDYLTTGGILDVNPAALVRLLSEILIRRQRASW